MHEDDLEALQEKLRSYRPEDIRFNEPHFTHQLIARDGERDEVVHHLLDPVRLVYSYSGPGRYGDEKHLLHFRISNTRTMLLPVILGKTFMS